MEKKAHHLVHLFCDFISSQDLMWYVVVKLLKLKKTKSLRNVKKKGVDNYYQRLCTKTSNFERFPSKWPSSFYCNFRRQILDYDYLVN